MSDGLQIPSDELATSGSAPQATVDFAQAPLPDTASTECSSGPSSSETSVQSQPQKSLNELIKENGQIMSSESAQWSDKAQAFLAVAAIFKSEEFALYRADAAKLASFKADLHQYVFPHVAAKIADQRAQLCRDACRMVSEVVSEFKDEAKVLVENVMPALMKTLANPKSKVLVNFADMTILSLLKDCDFSFALDYFIEGVSDKNAVARERSCHYMLVGLKKYEAALFASDPKFKLDLVLAALKKAIADPKSEVREAAFHCLTAIESRWKDKYDALVSSLDPTSSKQLSALIAKRTPSLAGSSRPALSLQRRSTAQLVKKDAQTSEPSEPSEPSEASSSCTKPQDTSCSDSSSSSLNSMPSKKEDEDQEDRSFNPHCPSPSSGPAAAQSSTPVESNQQGSEPTQQETSQGQEASTPSSTSQDSISAPSDTILEQEMQGLSLSEFEALEEAIGGMEKVKAPFSLVSLSSESSPITPISSYMVPPQTFTPMNEVIAEVLEAETEKFDFLMDSLASFPVGSKAPASPVATLTKQEDLLLSPIIPTIKDSENFENFSFGSPLLVPKRESHSSRRESLLLSPIQLPSIPLMVQQQVESLDLAQIQEEAFLVSLSPKSSNMQYQNDTELDHSFKFEGDMPSSPEQVEKESEIVYAPQEAAHSEDIAENLVEACDKDTIEEIAESLAMTEMTKSEDTFFAPSTETVEALEHSSTLISSEPVEPKAVEMTTASLVMSFMDSSVVEEETDIFDSLSPLNRDDVTIVRKATDGSDLLGNMSFEVTATPAKARKFPRRSMALFPTLFTQPNEPVDVKEENDIENEAIYEQEEEKYENDDEEENGEPMSSEFVDHDQEEDVVEIEQEEIILEDAVAKIEAEDVNIEDMANINVESDLPSVSGVEVEEVMEDLPISSELQSDLEDGEGIQSAFEPEVESASFVIEEAESSFMQEESSSVVNDEEEASIVSSSSETESDFIDSSASSMMRSGYRKTSLSTIYEASEPSTTPYGSPMRRKSVSSAFSSSSSMATSNCLFAALPACSSHSYSGRASLAHVSTSSASSGATATGPLSTASSRMSLPSFAFSSLTHSNPTSPQKEEDDEHLESGDLVESGLIQDEDDVEDQFQLVASEATVEDIANEEAESFAEIISSASPVHSPFKASPRQSPRHFVDESYSLQDSVDQEAADLESTPIQDNIIQMVDAEDQEEVIQTQEESVPQEEMTHPVVDSSIQSLDDSIQSTPNDVSFSFLDENDVISLEADDELLVKKMEELALESQLEFDSLLSASIGNVTTLESPRTHKSFTADEKMQSLDANTEEDPIEETVSAVCGDVEGEKAIETDATAFAEENSVGVFDADLVHEEIEAFILVDEPSVVEEHYPIDTNLALPTETSYEISQPASVDDQALSSVAELSSFELSCDNENDEELLVVDNEEEVQLAVSEQDHNEISPVVEAITLSDTINEGAVTEADFIETVEDACDLVEEDEIAAEIIASEADAVVEEDISYEVETIETVEAEAEISEDIPSEADAVEVEADTFEPATEVYEVDAIESAPSEADIGGSEVVVNEEIMEEAEIIEDTVIPSVEVETVDIVESLQSESDNVETEAEIVEDIQEEVEEATISQNEFEATETLPSEVETVQTEAEIVQSASIEILEESDQAIPAEVAAETEAAVVTPVTEHVADDEEEIAIPSEAQDLVEESVVEEEAIPVDAAAPASSPEEKDVPVTSSTEEEEVPTTMPSKRSSSRRAAPAPKKVSSRSRKAPKKAASIAEAATEDEQSEESSVQSETVQQHEEKPLLEVADISATDDVQIDATPIVDVVEEVVTTTTTRGRRGAKKVTAAKKTARRGAAAKKAVEEEEQDHDEAKEEDEENDTTQNNKPKDTPAEDSVSTASIPAANDQSGDEEDSDKGGNDHDEEEDVAPAVLQRTTSRRSAASTAKASSASNSKTKAKASSAKVSSAKASASMTIKAEEPVAAPPTLTRRTSKRMAATIGVEEVAPVQEEAVVEEKAELEEVPLPRTRSSSRSLTSKKSTASTPVAPVASTPLDDEQKENSGSNVRTTRTAAQKKKQDTTQETAVLEQPTTAAGTKSKPKPAAAAAAAATATTKSNKKAPLQEAVPDKPITPIANRLRRTRR
jgi:hypothetical protein